MQYHATLQFKPDADPVNVVMMFRGEWVFLSNMFPAKVGFKERVYPATENAYYAWRTGREDFRDLLQEMTPKEAKAFSKTEDYKASERELVTPVTRVLAMASFVRQKFFIHEELGDRLLATGDALLIEGNTWGDRLFGFDLITGQGTNALGRMLMAVRQELAVARKAA